jgi:hypothetical protein
MSIVKIVTAQLLSLGTQEVLFTPKQALLSV